MKTEKAAIDKINVLKCPTLENKGKLQDCLITN